VCSSDLGTAYPHGADGLAGLIQRNDLMLFERKRQQCLINDEDRLTRLMGPNAGAGFTVNFHGTSLMDSARMGTFWWSKNAGCGIISISNLGYSSWLP